MKLENIILPGDVKRMLAECEYIYIPENEKALYIAYQLTSKGDFKRTRSLPVRRVSI